MTEQNFDKIINDDSILFFDLDGTLVDTDYANYLAYTKAISHFFPKNGSQIKFDPHKRLNRSKLKESFPNLPTVTFERMVKLKEKVYNDYLPKTSLINSCYRILSKFSKTNNCILVTNCRKNRAFAILTHHEIKDNFTQILYRECYSKQKGKANKFLYAINTLKIQPERVVLFENEKKEIENAFSVGIKTINPKIEIG